MNLTEQYRALQLAYQLVEQNQWNLLHINDKTSEIWLEKYENKTSVLIRIIARGFDWKNHLKQDIGIAFQKVKSMKDLLRGKHTVVHNVYVTELEPVDDWELLKRPLKLKEKTPIKMNVYYLSEQNFHSELDRFNKMVENEPFSIMNHKTDIEMENDIQLYRQYLHKALKNKRKEERELFSFGKSRLTYAIIILNVFLLLFLELNGGSQNIETLIQYGANYNPAILQGEWWRLVSSMFLHIGFLHLFMNMLALYYLGTLIEKIYGSSRFLLIYFLAGIGGSLASFVVTVNVSAGASGAIFGLFGALLYFGMNYKDIFFKTMGQNVIIILLINVVIGFAIPQVDAWAHMGGLVAGFFAAMIVQLPKKKKSLMSLLGVLLTIVLILGLILYGTSKNEQDAAIQLALIDEFIQEDDFEAIIDSANKGLASPSDVEAMLLFQRAYAYIHLNEVSLAIEDLEKSIKIQENYTDLEKIPEAYYNLALLYHNTANPKAREMIEEAVRLRPDSKDFQQFYQQIVGS